MGMNSENCGYENLEQRERDEDAAMLAYENAVDDAELRISEIATECSALGIINDLVSDMQFVSLGPEMADETGEFRTVALKELRRMINELIGEGV